MKNLALFVLRVYKLLFSPLLHQLFGVKHACRYSPTCSEFAIIHIKKDGVVKGGLTSLLRILYCQPFVKSLPYFLRK